MMPLGMGESTEGKITVTRMAVHQVQFFKSRQDSIHRHNPDCVPFAHYLLLYIHGGHRFLGFTQNCNHQPPWLGISQVVGLEHGDEGGMFHGKQKCRSILMKKFFNCKQILDEKRFHMQKIY